MLLCNPSNIEHLNQLRLHPQCQPHHLRTLIIIKNNTLQDHCLQQTIQDHHHCYQKLPFQDHSTWHVANSSLHYYQPQSAQGHQPFQTANSNYPCYHPCLTTSQVQLTMEQSPRYLTIHCYTFQSSY